MLPLNPVDAFNSPYASVSALATDPGLLSPELLWRDGLLSKRQLGQFKQQNQGLTMLEARAQKTALTALTWRAAFGHKVRRRQFEEYQERQRGWLDDFALFVALADFYDSTDWTVWPKELRDRHPTALRQAGERFSEAIGLIKFGQFLFDSQWRKLRRSATEANIALVGDIPIFVNHNSADVWVARHDFLLDRHGCPTHVSGVPPDYFIKDGQLWGHALYDWPKMQSSGFEWWLQRFRRAFDLFDIVRIDHFIGFHRFWKIPASAKTARHGKWVVVPGAKLFSRLKTALGDLPVIAEDLGSVTPEVHALRKQFGFPGMRVLQFGMSDCDDSAYHRPHSFVDDTVCYPGTHDCNTINGWFAEITRSAKRGEPAAKSALRIAETLTGIIPGDLAHRPLMRLAHESCARVSIFQLQDVLGLPGVARMNVPGRRHGNWAWRWQPARSNVADFEFLRDLTSLTGRPNRGI